MPLAQSRSDIVVLGDNLAPVALTLLLARRTLRIVRQNLWWAAGYNAVGVPLAIAGYMPAWLAGLGYGAQFAAGGDECGAPGARFLAAMPLPFRNRPHSTPMPVEVA
ncbi:heavy metal translocating P-type ATPase [Alicycliphilus sp. B1]|nr:heavy metal translocating P-type ATPase [Alicycliphilus sp. B1]